MEQKIEIIKEACKKETGTNPIQIAKNLMKCPSIRIHGPEHHVLDGAAFLCALKNAGAEFDFDHALDVLALRGSQMPGAICGQWGVCGSSASIGAALAIFHETGPLSDNEYYKDNLFYTSLALHDIAQIGGPRCCKRNAFLSLQRAIQFVKEKYQINLDQDEIICEFSSKNQQCLHERCPFYNKKD